MVIEIKYYQFEEYLNITRPYLKVFINDLKIFDALRFCLNFCHSFRTKKKLESHKKLCEKKKFCSVEMPFDDSKILELNRYQKFDKAPFIIYADLECLMQKIDGCKNNSEDSSATTIGEHIPSFFSMFTTTSYKSIENKLDVYRGKNCMREFGES